MGWIIGDVGSIPNLSKIRWIRFSFCFRRRAEAMERTPSPRSNSSSRSRLRAESERLKWKESPFSSRAWQSFNPNSCLPSRNRNSTWKRAHPTTPARRTHATTFARKAHQTVQAAARTSNTPETIRWIPAGDRAAKGLLNMSGKWMTCTLRLLQHTLQVLLKNTHDEVMTRQAEGGGHHPELQCTTCAQPESR